MTDTPDLDPSETREWLESVEDVIDRDGTDRAHFLLDQAVSAARARGSASPAASTRSHPARSAWPSPVTRPRPANRSAAASKSGRCRSIAARRIGCMTESHYHATLRSAESTADHSRRPIAANPAAPRCAPGLCSAILAHE